MRKKLLMFFVASLCLMNIALAQTKKVVGKVTDGDGSPVANATVQIKGTTVGTATNEGGVYSINAQPRAVLVFSATGHKTVQITLQNQSEINVTLDRVDTDLDEVIVVAYGTVKKGDYTGSSAQISAKEIEARPIINVTNALVGSAPGIQTTASSGAPGSGPAIRLRGFGTIDLSASPLIVVDGVVFNGGINNINPDDVESVSTLKDASTTALFGSRGGNGVIMITTKKGKKNRNDLSFKVTQGNTRRAYKDYDKVGPADYYQLMWQSYRNNLANAVAPNNVPIDIANQIASGLMPRETAGANAGKQIYNGKYYDDLIQILGYNVYNVGNSELIDVNGKINPAAKLKYADDLSWEDAFMGVGKRQDYSLSYSGGNEKSDYYGSFGYNNEQGYATRSDIDRFSGRLSVNTNPVKWFKTGLNLSGTHIESSATSESSGIVNPFSFSSGMAPIYPVHLHDPVTGAYILDINGNKQYDIGSSQINGIRPRYGGRHALYENDHNEDRFKRTALGGRGYATINLTPHFKLTSNISLDIQDVLSQTYENKMVGDGSPSGRSTRTATKSTSYTFNQLATYTRKFGIHNVDVLAGHENYSYIYNYLYGYRIGQVVDGITEFPNFTTTSSLSSRTDRQTIESYLSRVNYDYDGRYFLSGSLRRDGNSRFPVATRWDNFWSVGAAWRMDREKFISSVSFVDQLKLRASYGKVGNDGGLSYYPYQAFYNLGYNNATEPGFVLGSIANDQLKWETSTSLDVGIDFGVLKNRITGTVEYFDRTTSGLISAVRQPLANGGTVSGEYIINQNVGELYNRGFEASLTGAIVQSKDFRWSMTINATTFKNMITKMPPTQKEVIDGTKKRMEGRSVYDYFLREFYGVDPNDGAALYKNVITYNEANSRIVTNAKGGKDTVTTVLTNSRQVYVDKTSIPDVYGSIANTFSYKGFELSFLITYQIGGWAYDSQYGSLMHAGTYGTAMHVDALKAWQKPGDITNVPRMQNNINSDLAGGSTRWLLKADYISLNNINLGYNIPTSALSKIQAKNAKVFVSAENVGFFAKRKGTMVNTGFAGTNSSSNYPIAMILSAGVNVTF